MTNDLKPEAQTLLKMVASSPSRLTPPALEKIISENTHLEKREIKALVKDLVARGELAYTYEFGSTFLEISFNRPIRISNSVVIKPPGHQYRPESGDVVLKIKPGASFGDGRHPTTRLAIRGIEYVLKEFKLGATADQSSVLDIGTGSGILVLTAIRMGIHRGVGIDIDPAARFEARENVSINRLEDRIEISDQNLESIEGSFYLVTANLRYPTLKKICPSLRRITDTGGFLVFSGIRNHELSDFIKAYAGKNLEVVWQGKELDWMGVVLTRINREKQNANKSKMMISQKSLKIANF